MEISTGEKEIMEKNDYFTKPGYYHPAMDVKGFNALANLALDIRWSTFSSFCSYTTGAALPLLVTVVAPFSHLIPILSIMSVLFLTLLGGFAAKIGGFNIIVGSIRVAGWGTLAMFLSISIGSFNSIIARLCLIF